MQGIIFHNSLYFHLLGGTYEYMFTRREQYVKGPMDNCKYEAGIHRDS